MEWIGSSDLAWLSGLVEFGLVEFGSWSVLLNIFFTIRIINVYSEKHKTYLYIIHLSWSLV